MVSGFRRESKVVKGIGFIGDLRVVVRGLVSAGFVDCCERWWPGGQF